MADLKADVEAKVKLSAPVLYSGGGSTNSLPQFSQLKDEIVKAHDGKLYLLRFRNSETPYWLPVQDESIQG